MLTAVFKNGETRAYTKNAYQFDKGQQLLISGLDLPESCEVHVSNDKDTGIAIAYEKESNVFTIPDAFFESGDYVYIWIYLKNNSNEESEDGVTSYEIVIPVTRRPNIVLGSSIYQ